MGNELFHTKILLNRIIVKPSYEWHIYFSPDNFKVISHATIIGRFKCTDFCLIINSELIYPTFDSVCGGNKV
jgi:hypothetical protein